MIEFYRNEWKIAEKEGNTEYAENCKKQYRLLVMESLKRPYKQYVEKLKEYPPIWLN